MFYRLPYLFSIVFLIALLVAQVLLLGLSFGLDTTNINQFYEIALDDLTLFFFIFILSNLFFYQNRIYFYIRKNKLSTVILALCLAIIYLSIKSILLRLSIFLFSHYFIELYGNYYHYTAIAYAWTELIADLSSYFFIAVILLFMLKFGRKYFRTPLTNGISQSSSFNLLSSSMTNADNRQFYSVIFASVFCLITHGLPWSIYFNLFSSVDEINLILDDYYHTLVLFALVTLIFNYFFLYYVSKKFIIKTYPRLPTTGLLVVSAITALSYGFCFILIGSFFISFVFLFNSIVILLGMLILCYTILYYITGFMLRRYFA